MAKKTRLTAGLVSSIASNIVRDIPQIDYESIIQDYFNKRAFEELPEVLKDDSLKEYLAKGYVSGFSLYVFNTKFKPTLEDSAFVNQQAALEDKQRHDIRAIRSSLGAEISACKYVEVFAERFPEFVKYLPVEQEPITNLPAIQLKETLASLGWPKSDEGK